MGYCRKAKAPNKGLPSPSGIADPVYRPELEPQSRRQPPTKILAN